MNLNEVPGNHDIFWVRVNNGVLTAALREKDFPSDVELREELASLTMGNGTVHRILADRLKVGEELKRLAQSQLEETAWRESWRKFGGEAQVINREDARNLFLAGIVFGRQSK